MSGTIQKLQSHPSLTEKDYNILKEMLREAMVNLNLAVECFNRSRRKHCTFGEQDKLMRQSKSAKQLGVALSDLCDQWQANGLPYDWETILDKTRQCH